MVRINACLVALLLVLAQSVSAFNAPAPGNALATRRPPNIIVIITDDQGYGDLACHGNPIVRTPHLDRLHAQSVRFTDFHVSPTCAPTRAALLTGRHEFRSGVTHTLAERERLGLQAITLPQILQSAGYTTGIFGKWHLGDEDAYQPNRRGFDEVFIHGAGGIGQSFPGSCGDAPGNKYFDPLIKHNGKFVKTSGYCTDVFFERATNWIAEQRGKQRDGKNQGDPKPFFAWIATNAPHAPLDCPPKYQQMYDGRPPNEAAFFGMITNIDDNVGRLLTKLKEWELDRETIVIFMTDNGGTAGVNVFNAGMRGKKVTPYSGGTRVPCFVRWTGKLKAGVDVDRLAAHLDILPTLCELTGVKLPADVMAKVEGRSLVSLLKDPAAEDPAIKKNIDAWPDRTLVTHVGRWPRGKAADAKYANCSIRNARYHLVSASKDGAKNWELFDLQTDPGEKKDIAAEKPETVRELETAYDRWWESVQKDLVNEDAVGPKVNPFKEQYERQFGS